MIQITIDQIIEMSTPQVQEYYGRGNADSIIRQGCLITGITEEVLTSSYRGRQVVDVRACLMAIIRQRTRLSLAAIGQLFNRDHATTLHNLRAIDNVKYCPDLEKLYNELKTKIV